jgi:hypothetical protein
VKKQLADPAKNWALEETGHNTWKLYQVTNGMKINPTVLKRARGY